MANGIDDPADDAPNTQGEDFGDLGDAGAPPKIRGPRVWLDRAMAPIDRVETIWIEILAMAPGTIYHAQKQVVEIVDMGHGECATVIMSDDRLLHLIDRARIVAIRGPAKAPIEDRPTRDDRTSVFAAREQFAPELRDLWRCPYLAYHEATENGDSATYSIVETPGYDPNTKRYLSWNQGPLDAGSMHPREAVKAVNALLNGFPFESDADMIHGLGLLLMPILRPAIKGPTPLHMITGPVAGAGKTYLAELVGAILGKVNVAGLERWSGEQDRELASYLIKSESLTFLDNIPYDTLEKASPKWLSWLTADSPVSVRMLGGGNQTVEVTVRTIWVATALDLPPGTEMKRRMAPIRFTHATAAVVKARAANPEIVKKVIKDRHHYVRALMCLVEAWIHEGAPLWTGTPLASFEHWSRLVGGVASYIWKVLQPRGAAPRPPQWLAAEHRPKSQEDRDFEELLAVWNERVSAQRRGEVASTDDEWPTWMSTQQITQRCSAAGLMVSVLATEGRSGETRVGTLLTTWANNEKSATLPDSDQKWMLTRKIASGKKLYGWVKAEKGSGCGGHFGKAPQKTAAKAAT